MPYHWKLESRTSIQAVKVVARVVGAILFAILVEGCDRSDLGVLSDGTSLQSQTPPEEHFTKIHIDFDHLPATINASDNPRDRFQSLSLKVMRLGTAQALREPFRKTPLVPSRRPL